MAWETFMPICDFSTFLCFRVRGQCGTDRQTDGRTNRQTDNTRNVAYRTPQCRWRFVLVRPLSTHYPVSANQTRINSTWMRVLRWRHSIRGNVQTLNQKPCLHQYWPIDVLCIEQDQQLATLRVRRYRQYYKLSRDCTKFCFLSEMWRQPYTYRLHFNSQSHWQYFKKL